HLLAGDDGILDPRNLDHRLHRLFLRVLPWGPDVPRRHHARRRPSLAEMVTVLLRTVLSDCNLPRPSSRCRASPSFRYSVLLARRYLGYRPIDVETRPWPLPGCWRLKLTSE